MSERKHSEFYQLKSQSFFKDFAQRYLAYLGNYNPNKTQLTEMMDLLSHVWLRNLVTLDTRLTDIERQCLYLRLSFKLLNFVPYPSVKCIVIKKIF